MLSLLQSSLNFIANYTGPPFMQSLRSFTSMWRVLILCAALPFACLHAVLPDINSALHLAESYPPEFVTEISFIMACNIGVVLAFTAVVSYLTQRRHDELAQFAGLPRSSVPDADELERQVRAAEATIKRLQEEHQKLTAPPPRPSFMEAFKAELAKQQALQEEMLRRREAQAQAAQAQPAQR